ncbi:hypothetical protein [Desulfuromonas acetoxidans]|nr:hypothetical protein [Desulfuromonas acetoxidans]
MNRKQTGQKRGSAVKQPIRRTQPMGVLDGDRVYSFVAGRLVRREA